MEEAGGALSTPTEDVVDEEKIAALSAVVSDGRRGNGAGEGLGEMGGRQGFCDWRRRRRRGTKERKKKEPFPLIACLALCSIVIIQDPLALCFLTELT